MSGKQLSSVVVPNNCSQYVRVTHYLITMCCVLWSASCGDVQLHLTHEQLRICNYNMHHGEVIKIVAFAGMSNTDC